jgi:hypothetical protein
MNNIILETCRNCGRTIKGMEQAFVFDDHVVCEDCRRELLRAKIEKQKHYTPPQEEELVEQIREVAEAEVIPYATPARYEPPSPPPISSAVPPCPGCGARAAAIRKQQGSMGLCVLLLLLWLLPGILYYALCCRYAMVCPQCGLKRGEAA